MLWFPSNAIECQVAREWVIERLEDNTDIFADGYPIVVVKQLPDGDAVIRAAIILSNYTGNNVFIAGASDVNGFFTTRDIADALYAAFRPPLAVLRMTALVSEANKRSARLMQGFGFKLEGILRDYDGEGSRTLVYGLTKSDFLGGRYGRKAQQHAAESNNGDGSGREPVCGPIRAAG